jgi:hypothetical protein
MTEQIIRDVTGKKLSFEDLEFTSKRVTEGEWVGRFIVDTNKLKIYAIPHEIDHPEFVGLLVGKSRDEMKNSPMDYSYFVAVSIAVVDGIVTRTLIGISGFEMVMATAAKKLLEKKEKNPGRAKQLSTAPLQYHNNQQLARAREVAYQYIFEGEIPLDSSYKETYVRVI